MENREIKFRAWNLIEKKWYYHDALGEIEIVGNCTLGGFNFDGYVDYHLMQYTGLKDKNGVEIYENDVIDYYYKDQAIRGVVQFGKVSWCIFYKTPKGFDRLNRLNPKAEIEVIGNIYENPELL